MGRETMNIISGPHIYNSVIWFDVIDNVKIGDIFVHTTTYECQCCGYTYNETNKYRVESFYKFPGEETTRIISRKLYQYNSEIISKVGKIVSIAMS